MVASSIGQQNRINVRSIDQAENGWDQQSQGCSTKGLEPVFMATTF